MILSNSIMYFRNAKQLTLESCKEELNATETIDKQSGNGNEPCVTAASVHTSGTPIHDCQEGKLVESSASERCSGSEMHDYIHPMRQYILRWLPMPGWPDTQYSDP